MLGTYLWRLWKWILHLITGQCELYRISVASTAVQQRTTDIVNSLKLSRIKALRDLVEQLGLSVNVEISTQIIIKEKSIKPAQQLRFIERVTPCLVRVSGVKELWGRIEEMRAEPYQQANQQHEDALMELWKNLMVGSELTDRISKQWQEIGFQGNNPATDFRGMGLLGLKCLLYFSTQHRDKARSVLLHSKHPQLWYPFAVVGIDLTGVVYSWLKDGSLNYYLYSSCTVWPPPPRVFMEIFCFIFCQFDSFWTAEEPENVMAFPKVKVKFLKQLKPEFNKENTILSSSGF